jgi:hypothetical protein
MPIHKCYTCKYETVADDAVRCPKCGTKEHDFPPAWKFFGSGLIMLVLASIMGGWLGGIMFIASLISIGVGLFRPLIRSWASKQID